MIGDCWYLNLIGVVICLPFSYVCSYVAISLPPSTAKSGDSILYREHVSQCVEWGQEEKLKAGQRRVCLQWHKILISNFNLTGWIRADASFVAQNAEKSSWIRRKLIDRLIGRREEPLLSTREQRVDAQLLSL